MRITVLGKSPSWQDADGACSGYLIEDEGISVLLDCGNGVFSKLRRFRDYTTVDAVLISHLHADHFLDLVPYSYALTYAPRQQPVPVDRWPGTDNPARPVLYAPLGAGEVFRRVVGAWGNDDLVEKAFDLREYDGSEHLELGRPARALPRRPALPDHARDGDRLRQRGGALHLRSRLPAQRGPGRVRRAAPTC